MTGLNNTNLFLREFIRLVSADVGESRWEIDDQEATQLGDDLWPDECLQAVVTHQGWSTHTMTGMIGRWRFFSSQPNLQYPVPTRPTWRIPWWEDKPGWKQILIYPPPKFKKLKFSSKKQPSVFNKHPRRRKRREECANIIQPKHLPAARLFIFIRTVVCYADTCVFFSFDFRK